MCCKLKSKEMMENFNIAATKIKPSAIRANVATHYYGIRRKTFRQKRKVKGKFIHVTGREGL
jgi:hypothetical protein